MRHLAIGAIAAALVGCTNLPVGGPLHVDIERHATASLKLDRHAVVKDYVLVDISNDVLREIMAVYPGTFHTSFGLRKSPGAAFKLGVGDLVQVTIFESAAGGLFASSDASLRPGNFVALPQMAVAQNGTVTVPYAGDVRAAGRTPQEFQKEIERKLASRAIEPQVLVALGEQVTASVTLIGETASKLQLRGNERVLDLIARAGGARIPPHELFVTLIRGQKRATVYFPTLLREPNENIYVAPGDTIYVYREQQRFIAVGAFASATVTSGVTGQFAFEQERLSLNEAVAKAGGLIDARSSAKVFIYRFEDRNALERMGVDISRFGDQERIPTVYRANFRDPSVYFFTQQFYMRHRDAIYVTNSDSIELEKFLAHTQAITGTIASTTGDIRVTREDAFAIGRGVGR